MPIPAIISSILSIAGTGAQTAGSIKSLIPKPDKGRQDAAALQTNIQQAATEIERLVASGEMDPDAAIDALNVLQTRAVQLGSSGDPNLQRASQIAGIVIANVRANVQSSRTRAMNEPIGEAGLSGAPGFQRDKFKSLIGNALIGHERGAQLGGTPIGQLFQPRQSAMARFTEYRPEVERMIPDRIGPDFSEQIKQSLKKYLGG